MVFINSQTNPFTKPTRVFPKTLSIPSLNRMSYINKNLNGQWTKSLILPTDFKFVTTIINPPSYQKKIKFFERLFLNMQLMYKFPPVQKMMLLFFPPISRSFTFTPNPLFLSRAPAVMVCLWGNLHSDNIVWLLVPCAGKWRNVLSSVRVWSCSWNSIAKTDKVNYRFL